MMTIMGKHFNRRGVSVIIAALLLIAIAMAAAVLLYVFSIGLMGSLQGSGGQQIKQQLIMGAYNWNTPTGPLTLSMRNVGTAGAIVGDVLVNGVAQSVTVGGTGTGCNSPTNAIPVQTACTITITTFATGTFGSSQSATSRVAYPVKVVSKDGGVFSYSAIAGRSS